MKKAISIFAVMLSFITVYASGPDILITQAGESIKVYNVEVSSSSIFYTLSDEADASVKKISKNDVLIIKRNDGTILNICNADAANQTLSDTKVTNPAAHEPVTHHASESEFFIVEKKGKKNTPAIVEKYILVSDGKNQVLNMMVLSEDDKTLSVVKPRKDMKYNLTEYVIPEYVMIGNDKYTVEEIGEGAFYNKTKIMDILFPETLRSIRMNAFGLCTFLRRIILPESIESIESQAFERCGIHCPTFEQLYIPQRVKVIGEKAFWFVGSNTSPRAYFQGNLTSKPSFITTGNCTEYGIDEEAVENYERKIGIRKD